MSYKSDLMQSALCAPTFLCLLDLSNLASKCAGHIMSIDAYDSNQNPKAFILAKDEIIVFK